MSVQVELLPRIVERIDALLAEKPLSPHYVPNALAATFGARTRFAHGTHELAIAGLKVTNTAGGDNLIKAWAARARRIIAEQSR